MNRDVSKSVLSDDRPEPPQSEAKPQGIVQRLVGSLAFKVGAAVIVTEILVLTGIGIPLIAQYNDDTDRRAVDRILIPGTLLQEGVLSYASVADRRIMTDLMGEELIGGMVVGGNGNVFYSLDPGHLGKEVGALPGIDPTWFDPSNTERQLIETRDDRDTFLISITPLFTLDSKVPSLFAYIKTNTSKLTEDKAAWRRLIFIGMLGVVMTTSLIIFISFQMLVFRRIARSADFVERVREGELETLLAEPGSDEFGTLERGMNEMVANLKRRQDQQTKAEEALRESEGRAKGAEQQLLDAIESISEGFVLFDADGRLVMCNSKYKEFYGYSDADTAPGTHTRDLGRLDIERGALVLKSDDHESYLSRRDNLKIDPSGSYNIHFVDGRLFQTRDHRTDAGGIVSIQTDITERKRLEEQLVHAQKMEAVGQLTGGVAHDFNNLLSVMIGNAEFLEGVIGEDEEAKEFIEEIKAAVGRGASLTSRLLAFSRQSMLSPVAADITGLIGSLEDMLRRTLGETIDLRVEATPDLWPATIDPHQFENALVNLALNAQDAMPNGGALTIETASVTLDETYAEHHEEVTPGDYVVVSVSDTGSGISPEVLEKVFEPFFTTKDVGKGSGLGLSMVYGFAKQSGGHITIYSEVGHGTTVKLYMPRSEEDVAKECPKDDTREIARGSERILLVEDDENLRVVTVRTLRKQGYEIVEAGDGKEAIEHLKDGQLFDLLFTDVVLPGGMNGVEIAEEVKRIQPGIKVLYTTGYAENAVVHNGQLDPGVPLINKPYRREELLDKVRSMLDSKDD